MNLYGYIFILQLMHFLVYKSYYMFCKMELPQVQQSMFLLQLLQLQGVFL